MGDLIAELRERAEFEDKRVLDEAKALGFVPEVYSGSQTGALLREAAAALEAAREDACRWKELCRQIDADEIPGGIFEDARHMGAGALEMHIDQARGKGGGEGVAS